jgi:hypothetical protein
VRDTCRTSELSEAFIVEDKEVVDWGFCDVGILFLACGYVPCCAGSQGCATVLCPQEMGRRDKRLLAYNPLLA